MPMHHTGLCEGTSAQMESAPMLSEAMKLLTWGDGMTHPV